MKKYKRKIKLIMFLIIINKILNIVLSLKDLF